VRELASQSICEIARNAFDQIPSALLSKLVSLFYFISALDS
jgi:hypothetical protein